MAAADHSVNHLKYWWAVSPQGRTLQVKITAAAAIAGAILFAAPANADGPAVGSPCREREAEKTGTSSTGEPIRCMAKADSNGHVVLIWMVDTDTAEGTIGALKDQGYTVHIDRVGTAKRAECTVTNVRKTNSTSKTVQVSLNCSGTTTPEMYPEMKPKDAVHVELEQGNKSADCTVTSSRNPNPITRTVQVSLDCNGNTPH
jgi:hypothetical protein